MTAALLMVGALFSNVQAQIEESTPAELANDAVITNGAKYYLGDGSGKYVQASLKAASDKATKKVLTPAEAASADLATLFEAVVTNTGGTELIQFKATVGDFTGFLSVDATGAVFTTPTAANIDAAKSGFDYIEKYVNGTGIELALHGVSSKGLKGDGTVGDGSDKVMFYQPASITVKADELYKQNANRNTLSFGVKDIKSSLFGKSFKAFEVTASTVDVDGKTTTYVPAGTYFATSYPEELAASSVQTITKIEDFQKCTFIAVDPVTSLGDKDDLKAGKYMSFKEVAGKNLRFATTTGSEVSVNNAAFTVTTTMAQKDVDGNHSFSIAATFNYRPEAAKAAHTSASGVITVDKIGGVKVLSISKGAAASYIFTLSAGPVAKPIDLLSETGASVYNVKFLSGKAEEELGKYLGAGISTSGASAFEFLAQGTAVANLSTPQYQFVISEVDTETNEITFTNRETKEGFTCLLDTTTTGGVYNVVSITKTGSADPEDVKVANLGTNGKYDFTTTIDMTGKTIQLIPATVDMFAGFSVRGTELDQTFITFAKDENDADRFYVKAKYDTSGPSVTQEKATDDAIEASLFELVRSEKPVFVRSDYAYDNDGEVGYVSNGDTVAYYTYYIKYVNPAISGDNQFYMKKVDLGFEQKTPAGLTTAHEFILKENNDGSVSIIAAPTVPAFAAYDMAAVKFDKGGSDMADISAGVDAYLNANVTDFKLFLVKEGLGATFDATPAHVALHATTGGYVSLSEKNEGIVAIETAVSEDLTFWLDTADSKATLPMFYISKAMNKTMKSADTDRLFMYFAQDSADYFVEKEGVKNPYKWSNGEAKIIFKAATLVNADTLATTANGKAVNVAVAADVNGTQGGLNNFRFQIFKADDAEDAYVVRNAGGQYLVSIANQLQLGEKKDALKLYAEEGMSPVANDAISVSSISVISENGAIIVKGAQGKKVVVSNVLGQQIANTVASSDEATIAAPAGIVVVAVEGETAVKAIVK